MLSESLKRVFNDLKFKYRLYYGVIWSKKKCNKTFLIILLGCFENVL